MTVRLDCRYCRHYAPEGRRGGTCQKLGVPVQGSWTACSLVHPSFSNDIDKPVLDESLAAGSAASTAFPPVSRPALAKSSQIPA